MRILVTGNKSGLGKYLFENIGTAGIDRNTTNDQKQAIQKEGVDVIIHCAFNSSNEVTSESLLSYIQDNVLFTKELAEIPHEKFIFVSSVDVYEKNAARHTEDEVLDVNTIEGIYGITKLISESVVREYAKEHLIVRSTAFLGPYSRKSSLRKIIEDEEPVVTLTPDSEFNYVLYEHVLEFIRIAIEKDVKGIYNIASSENIQLSEVAEMFKKNVTFGEYRYTVGHIDNTKAASLFPAFKKTSQEIIKEFITL